MAQLDGKNVAILATDGFEQSELLKPQEALNNAGATVKVVSLESGKIRGWDGDDWGDSVDVDMVLDDARPDDFDALVLPGGQINPDLLRVEPKAIQFVKDIFEAKKPIAAICHAPWLLIEADIVKGRKATSYHSIKTDMINAGADWVDEEVVCHQALITSRNPGDLDAFCAKTIEEIAEGRHPKRKVA